MKKLITISSLIVAGTLFASAATNIVFESKLTSSSITTFPVPEVPSVWQWAYGNNKATTISNAGTFVKSGSTNNIIAGAGNYTAALSKSLTLGNMYSATDLSGVGSVKLDSLSFLTRFDTSNTQNVAVRVKSGGTVLGTSGTVVYDEKAGTNNICGAGTLTFSGKLVLDLNTAYTFEFGILTNGTFTPSDNSNKIGFGVLNPWYFSSQGGGYQIDGANNYQPVFKINASAVPEPSAFGLLAGLGALALAGTRRRRR